MPFIRSESDIDMTRRISFEAVAGLDLVADALLLSQALVDGLCAPVERRNAERKIGAAKNLTKRGVVVGRATICDQPKQEFQQSR